jgi:hypothetical protein
MTSGKNVVPVRVWRLAAGSDDSAPVGVSRCWTGFSPSTAANSDDTGGNDATWCATPAGTPCCFRAPASDAGRRLASPAIMSEKNTPIDRAVPEFWNVERIPDAAPRWDAGTLPMIDDELGAPNIPTPMPLRTISAANAQ